MCGNILFIAGTCILIFLDYKCGTMWLGGYVKARLFIKQHFVAYVNVVG